jgi:hypothetical protein
MSQNGVFYLKFTADDVHMFVNCLFNAEPLILQPLSAVLQEIMKFRLSFGAH